MTDLKISALSDGAPVVRDDLFVIARGSGNKKLDAQGLGLVSYRKTTAKQVTSTTSETDLLNSEITVAANAMGTDRLLRLVAFGDWVNNTAGALDLPRLKLKLGGTTLLDAGGLGANCITQGASRWGWSLEAEIMNLGATNSQWSNMKFVFTYTGFSALPQWNSFTTGVGRIQGLASDNTHSQMTWGEGGNSSSVDTTAACALVLSATNPSSSGSYDITLKGALVEIR